MIKCMILKLPPLYFYVSRSFLFKPLSIKWARRRGDKGRDGVPVAGGGRGWDRTVSLMIPRCCLMGSTRRRIEDRFDLHKLAAGGGAGAERSGTGEPGSSPPRALQGGCTATRRITNVFGKTIYFMKRPGEGISLNAHRQGLAAEHRRRRAVT